MPCHDPYFYQVHEPYPHPQFVIDRLNAATRAACEALTILDKLIDNGTINGIVLLPETEKWWEEHKRHDEGQ